MIKKIISHEPTKDNLSQTLMALKGWTGVDSAGNLWLCGKAVQLMDNPPDKPAGF